VGTTQGHIHHPQLAMEPITGFNPILHRIKLSPKEEKGKQFISLTHKMFLKDINITQMEEDQYYIPVSARVSFKLQAWKEVEVSPNFVMINSETTALVKTF
jgi:hypothetical protein